MIPGIVASQQMMGAAGSGIPFADVAFLWGANGTDGATSASSEDSGARTITFVGNAQIDTGRTKYGSAALLLDGSGDYCTVPNSTDWHPQGIDMTWEAWIYPTTLATSWRTVFDRGGGAGFRSYFLQIMSDGGLVAQYAASSGSAFTSINGTAGKVTINTWNHVAWCRTSAGVWTFWANGTAAGGGSDGGTIASNNIELKIGAARNLNNDNFAGSIDEMRITRGHILYTGAYTAPTGEFPRS